MLERISFAHKKARKFIAGFFIYTGKRGSIAGKVWIGRQRLNAIDFFAGLNNLEFGIG